MYPSLRPIYQLREMREEDLTLVFKWRNHPKIRKTSQSDRLITWQEHLTWFRSGKSIMYVFTEDSRVVGVLNFKENNYWSFYVDPDLPPRSGYGQLMLTTYITQNKQYLHPLPIKAKVLSTNLASIKLHTKLGFQTVSAENSIVELLLDW